MNTDRERTDRTGARREGPGEAAGVGAAPGGRAVSDATRITLRAFATSVAVAVAVSVAAALLFVGVPRLVGQDAPGGCCGTPAYRVE